MTAFTDKDVICIDAFLFFWRGWPAQWFRSPFTVNETPYSCCEQYMMAEKARVFGDQATLQKILAATSPKNQKALGREVLGFDDATWNGVCRGIVYSANLAKFQQNADLAAKLEATGNLTMVEASPVDCIWGIGLTVDNPEVRDPTKWRGANWLGIALMQVRSTLRGEPMDALLLKQLETRRNMAPIIP
jgi:ribA/ribD-fused uncharacterized protein